MEWKVLEVFRARMRNRRMAWCFICCCALLLGGFVMPTATAESAVKCVASDVPVSAQGSSASIHGTLCAPANLSRSAVMVLVPGTTYTESYWDVPIDPDIFNFRLAMNRAGFATFTLDRLGSGRSSMPQSSAVTGRAQADALHGVVQALRGGRIGGSSYSRVILGGHSLGSSDVLYEAAGYRDVDGVVLTGFTHYVNLPNVARLFLPGTGIVPAQDDPALTGRRLDPGYLTTLPAGRKLLYGPDDVPLQLQRWDESAKDVTSVMEVATAFPGAIPLPLSSDVGSIADLPMSESIVADVLVVNGEFDNIVCASLACDRHDSKALLGAEKAFYPRARSFDAAVVDGSGHDLNLSVHAPEYQRTVSNWMNRVVAAG